MVLCCWFVCCFFFLKHHKSLGKIQRETTLFSKIPCWPTKISILNAGLPSLFISAENLVAWAELLFNLRCESDSVSCRSSFVSLWFWTPGETFSFFFGLNRRFLFPGSLETSPPWFLMDRWHRLDTTFKYPAQSTLCLLCNVREWDLIPRNQKMIRELEPQWFILWRTDLRRDTKSLHPFPKPWGASPWIHNN